MRSKTLPAASESGQALAELAVCLPLLFLLVFGLIQLIFIAIASYFTHYAAVCAARTYTVYAPRDERKALRLAQEAAETALKTCRPRPQVSVTLVQDLDLNHFNGPNITRTDLSKRLDRFYKVRAQVSYPLMFPFPGRHKTFEMSSLAVIQGEKTKEFMADQEAPEETIGDKALEIAKDGIPLP